MTKYRRKIFTRQTLDSLQLLFSTGCKAMGGELVEFNGEGDHVHLLVSYPPKVAVADLVRRLKGMSARALRCEFHLRGRHLWSPSYCAVACGGASLAILQAYIQNQEAV